TTANARPERSPSVVRRSSFVVIGYGNDLRGDDAAGRRVVEAVADLGLPGVQALSLPQLAPELAELLAGARVAIFVDACLSAGDDRVRVRELAPADPTALGHTSSPAWLLALAGQLYGRSPPAWLVAVPAHNLALGARLSARTQRACAAAIAEVRRLIRTTPGG
ncbi:MAG TPA: hydrogenase maturation protease, partial [Roseiflexaceae bacterium]|nr:hydrogenase maturation protease [Roseiflexaceae bacterium]